MNRGYDNETVDAARQGSEEALERLLLQCQPDMVRFARKVCATPEDVEDAVQETLWIVSQKIGTLRTVSAFASWAFRVVKHECYRLYRKAKRETSSDNAAEPAYFDPSVDVHTFIRQETVKALSALPDILREVIVMRDIKEMSAPAVADSLGLTIPAVKSRLHRGRTMLRSALEQWME